MFSVDDTARWAPPPSAAWEAPEREGAYAALVRSAAELASCPIGAISLLDPRREWLKAAHGWPSEQTGDSPRHLSFSVHVSREGTSLEVHDTLLDPRFAGHPWVAGIARLRFYAGEPLQAGGMSFGTLWLGDTRPRQLTAAQRDALRSLARVAAEMLLAQVRASDADGERARLLDFARASGDWMWETDAELRYTWVSGAFEAITGTAPSTLKGQTIYDSPLLDALGQPRGDGERFHTLLKRQQPIARVITDKRTARGLLQVSRSAVPIFDAAGRFAGYRGTARDVTAHIAAERRTHGQAELLRKLSAQVPGVIFQFWLQPDHHVSYTYASDASRRIFDAPAPFGTDGVDHGVVCRMLHPEDQAGFMASLIEAGNGLRPWVREYRVMRPDGAVRWLETRAVPEPHPAGGTLWHGFTADVTPHKEIELALRRSEARWGMAAAAAGIGVAQIGLRSGQMHLDPQACLNHGLPFPQTDFTIERWLAGIHPDDRARVESDLQKAIASHGTLEARFRWLEPTGVQPTLEVHARCVIDDAGQVDNLVGTCRDVTQQVAHEQLRHDKETAERASRAKSEFLSRVSHELRTPLNGILGFAQLMAIDRVHPLAADQARRLKSVLRAGRHLLELINDMLNLTRIEQEDFSLQQTAVDLAAMVDTCYALILPLAESNDAHLVAPTAVRDWALADTRAVEQVLLNLLSNAIKYNRRGGSVRVGVARHGERIAISVSDEGAGLSADQQAHLFQPFNRLGAEQRRVEGTGLGLVIARQLAAAMKGELTVQSMPEAGSTFTLWLPRAQAPATSPRIDSEFGAPLAEPPSLRRRVLYIEDEPLNVLLMQEVFKSRPQWELQIAADGRAGLELVRDDPHDLLLIDMNLPDMGGLDLIRTLRAQASTREVRCIALSADAMQPQIDAAMAAGFDGYWTKPINVAQILGGLADALGTPPA